MFTPGPWTADKRLTSYDEPTIVILAADASLATGEREIAEVWPDTRNIELDEANAHLIAAAPTMYSYIATRAASGDNKAIEILREIGLASEEQLTAWSSGHMGSAQP